MLKSKEIIVALVIGVSIPIAFSVIKNSRKDSKQLVSSVKSNQNVNKKREPELKKAPVNKSIFTVSKNMQDMFKLATESLRKDKNGYLIVSNSSIQDFNGEKVVFIDLGRNQFAVRNIVVNKIIDGNSLIADNLQVGEMIVDNGSVSLRDGLLRRNQNNQRKRSHGHSHGAGGHSH